MSTLFTPLTLGHLTLPSRIVIPPMCQYSANNGIASHWHLMHYGNLMLSGAGLLIIEATAVEPIGRISPNDLGLWDNETEQAMAEMVSALKSLSSMPIAIQLAHAGRKASSNLPWISTLPLTKEQGSWDTVAPSALAYSQQHPQPHALSVEQIQSIKQQFVDAAVRSIRCGFDAIEIHAAHGYLLHQFLSPLSNKREDHYGGNYTNRTRLLREIIEQITLIIPKEIALGVRISATDWVESGWDLLQSITLTHELKLLGCHFIDVSTGGLAAEQHIRPFPNYQVPFAKEIKAATHLPTITVGLIKEALQAEAIVATQQADMVAVGREMLYNPRWPWLAAEKLGSKLTLPNQYLRALPAR